MYCDSLSKSYDSKRYQFRDISLGVAAGSRIGLIGVNGVGKSTAMQILSGAVAPNFGDPSRTPTKRKKLICTFVISAVMRPP